MREVVPSLKMSTGRAQGLEKEPLHSTEDFRETSPFMVTSYMGEQLESPGIELEKLGSLDSNKQDRKDVRRIYLLTGEELLC